jgi:hypothetical protein
VNIKQRQPILKGLQRKTAKDKPDAERAEASLRKIVSIVFDVRIDRCPDACDEIGDSRDWATRVFATAR